MNIFLIIYFSISTIYAIVVYLKTYKSLSHFVMNFLFGPLNLIYLIYKIIFNVEDRY
jgi:hypothetical protein